MPNKQKYDMPQPNNSDKTLNLLLKAACTLGAASLLIAVFLLGRTTQNNSQSDHSWNDAQAKTQIEFSDEQTVPAISAAECGESTAPPIFEIGAPQSVLDDDNSTTIKGNDSQQHPFGQIVVGTYYVACLQSDGTVRFDGMQIDEVSQWGPLTQIAISEMDSFYGLSSDGLLHTNHSEMQKRIGAWRNISFFAVYSERTDSLSVSGEIIVAVTNSGDILVENSLKYAESVGHLKFDFSDWDSISSVAVGAKHIVGLKSDGTVVATGANDDGQCDVSGWKNIKSICAGSYCTVGVKSDGTVVVSGTSPEYSIDEQNAQIAKVSRWSHITQVGTRYGRFYGLTDDGRVLGFEDQMKVNYRYSAYEGIPENWVDMVSLSVGAGAVVGFRQDGTLIMSGGNQGYAPVLCHLVDANWPHGHDYDGSSISCQYCGKTFAVGTENPEHCVHYWNCTTSEFDQFSVFLADRSVYTCFKCGKQVEYRPVTLTNLEPINSSVGDRKNEDITIGNWMTKNGNTFENSIRFWVMNRPKYSDTEWIEYNLDAKYQTLEFNTDILDISKSGDDSISFVVEVDGRKIPISSFVRDNIVSRTIDVSGAKVLRIICTNSSADEGWGVFSGRLHYLFETT